jgi:hypothetical protein
MEQPVANIQLSDTCKRKTFHFKLINNVDKNMIIELSIYIKESVLSEAALKCTENVIGHNEGHYTAW